ncbi:erythrocyte membrane-associated antigen [Babesia bovis T2Bo]|uniref:Erythrocyte membrane-associated antigen n=1 Tax=Babesia bovis TaxID=5865 RepID=A7AUS3_BABBO|nr:erythrocyte membrane-associated antigen [Babesia bovis T2Bo]EDO06684.1 erythrocyte membrane-associated antigen [Babesia bovis T2Bo]|eukprot:XP_001610252.1 erythrocyte membrane-associated antigen [Babesia bovis T2Bo]
MCSRRHSCAMLLFLLAFCNSVVNGVTDDLVRLDPGVSKGESIVLDYEANRGYSFLAKIGNQDISLRVVSSLEGLILLCQDTSACSNINLGGICYDPKLSTSAIWCKNSDACIPGEDGYRCVEQSSHEGLQPVTTLDFYSEGIRHRVDTFEGYENVSLRNVGLLVPPIYERVPIKLATNMVVNNSLEFGRDIGGFFGIIGSSASCRGNSMWSDILQRYDGFYMLDLYGDVDTSTVNCIKLGSDVAKRDDILWSEKRQVGGIFTDSATGFTVYGMSMCGTDMFGKTSSNWHVNIDLTSQCLVLPKNFWFSVMAQLPILNSCYRMDGPKLCQLKRGDIEFLPEIQFRLHSQDDSIISIPLENLLLDDTATPRLCIVPQEDTYSPPIFTDRPTIKFGYKVLESLQVVVDTNGYRVGFLPKKPADTSDAICNPRVDCFGDQQYIPELNECIQPSCSTGVNEIAISDHTSGNSGIYCRETANSP